MTEEDRIKKTKALTIQISDLLGNSDLNVGEAFQIMVCLYLAACKDYQLTKEECVEQISIGWDVATNP